MYFRLVSTSLRKNHIFFERRFRIDPWKPKNVQEIKKSSDKISKNQPIKYSTSKAGNWKAIYSTSGESYFQTPRIQPLIVVLSLTAFGVYFGILREENDLDDWLKDLETDIPGQIEQAQLRSEIDIGHKRGIDVTSQVKRLKELKSRREKIND